MKTAVVVGAGPAGLMAAEMLADAGLSVVLADQKPTAARKFLMAGKSGLNLTKAESASEFLAAYRGDAPTLAPMIDAFGPQDVSDWTRQLGQEIFTGSSGRVFPKVMKASPLLRAWLARLKDKGVSLRTRWRWTGFAEGSLTFKTPDGAFDQPYDVAVFAMGGASWSRLGSDGLWAQHFDNAAPFTPCNMRILVGWSTYMSAQFGAPLKNITLIAGDIAVRGEAIISARGLEGGGIYAVSTQLRDGARLYLDLLPDLTTEEVAARWAKPHGKDSRSNLLRKRFKFDAAKIALINEFARNLPDDPAKLFKRFPIPVAGVAPLDEAISTGGGVRFSDLDASLMLIDRPGVFVAGEMLDWEAPTGGYLITACLATGRWAGKAAADYAAAAT